MDLESADFKIKTYRMIRLIYYQTKEEGKDRKRQMSSSSDSIVKDNCTNKDYSVLCSKKMPEIN